MGATNSLDCKNAARSVRNFNRLNWETAAGSLYKEGLKAKFHQNPYLLDTLINKTGNKKLVECANDHLWANGIPLYTETCLNQQWWISQGLLGKLLEDIRMELTPQVQHHTNDTPVADQPQPTGMHVSQALSSPTLPSRMVSSGSLPNMLNNPAKNK